MRPVPWPPGATVSPFRWPPGATVSPKTAGAPLFAPRRPEEKGERFTM